jgi:heat shock protein HtpX
MFIINPLSGMRLDSLFATHPPTTERIRRLLELAPPPVQAGGGRSLPEARGAASPPGPWSVGGRRNPWG